MAEVESMHAAIASTEYDSEFHQFDLEDDTLALRFLGGFRELSSRFDLQSSRASTNAGSVGISRPIRELYPRLGWHDVHAKVLGLPARDISSHFVQVPQPPRRPSDLCD